jgi:hypothetical protein
MRLVPFIALAAITLALFSGRADSFFQRGGNTKLPTESMTNVSELLRRAAAGEPLDGRRSPNRRWVGRMVAACQKRERSLTRVSQPTTAGGIAARGSQILAIHRAYSARVSSLGAPAGYAAEARQIRRFNASQRRILQRVIGAAQSGDPVRAYREAVALRELAGRANTTFLGLGLDQCAFRGSGMPL